jgi:hypothetical protein
MGDAELETKVETGIRPGSGQKRASVVMKWLPGSGHPAERLISLTRSVYL